MYGEPDPQRSPRPPAQICKLPLDGDLLGPPDALFWCQEPYKVGFTIVRNVHRWKRVGRKQR